MGHCNTALGFGFVCVCDAFVVCWLVGWYLRDVRFAGVCWFLVCGFGFCRFHLCEFVFEFEGLLLLEFQIWFVALCLVVCVDCNTVLVFDGFRFC